MPEGFNVALYTSAWIEMALSVCTTTRTKVALYTSAWIEIYNGDCQRSQERGRTLHECVDWNSTMSPLCMMRYCRTLHECVDWNCLDFDRVLNRFESHSTRVRGLKLAKRLSADLMLLSHSTRVRGLKLQNLIYQFQHWTVALYTSACIEIPRC